MKGLLPIFALLPLLPLAAQDPSGDSSSRQPLTITPEDVVSSHTVRSGQRDVTFQKVRPVELPSPTATRTAPATERETLSGTSTTTPTDSADVAARRDLFIGASAYVVTEADGSKQPYSHIRYQIDDKPIELWVKANFVWLSSRVATFSTGGEHWNLMVASSIDEVDASSSELSLPAFKGNSEIVVISGEPTASELAPIQALVTYYHENATSLEAVYGERVAEAQARRQERLADPPEQKELIIRYSRLDEPGKAESR